MTDASAPVPTARIREVTSRTDPALPAAYEMLRTTFHRSERVTLAEWRSALRERAEEVWTDYAWHLLVAEQRGQVVGLATGAYLGSVSVAEVGYLAISPDIRGGGLGTRLRDRLRHEFERDAHRLSRPLHAIVGEVVPDNPWLRALSRRPEVIVLDLPYFQPRLRLLDTASPFLLYYQSCGRHRRALPMLEVRRLLYAIYRQGYRLSRPLDNRAFRRMMRSLDGRRLIGSHPDFPPPVGG